MSYMPHPFVVIFGKAVRSIARLRGGGSALPGLFVEKIDPDFIKKTLAQLPHGVVVVSGTNGKTTTTKMVVALLEAHGLRVFTNRTGSNFTRGVAAALLSEIDLRGRLAADIAVLELDEAHAVPFVKAIPPQHSLILNVMRDQLDRFGEIDATAQLLSRIVESTSDSVVLNREDPRVSALAVATKAQVSYFGVSEDLRSDFPSDDELRSGPAKASTVPAASVVLESHTKKSATFSIGKDSFTTPLKINGVYNILNAAAAIGLTASVLGDIFDSKVAVAAIATVTPAFGRGETIMVGGQPLELVLVKNPSGFRLGLSSFSPKGYATMIAINDNYADGRDMSWLWDVDFASLRPAGAAAVSGIRAYDMAVRLHYENVTSELIDTDIAAALRTFISHHADTPKRIYCTYTAMLALRRELSKITTVEVVS